MKTEQNTPTENLTPSQIKPLDMISAVHLGVRAAYLDELQAHYDMFTRCDIGDESILDASCFDDEAMKNISKIIHRDLSEAQGCYIIFYVKS